MSTRPSRRSPSRGLIEEPLAFFDHAGTSGVIDRECVELFKTGLELSVQGHDDCDAFRDISFALHRRLNLKPWHPHVLDVTIDDEPPREAHHVSGFELVKKLRYKLIALT